MPGARSLPEAVFFATGMLRGNPQLMRYKKIDLWPIPIPFQTCVSSLQTIYPKTALMILKGGNQ
jgi:hypothetical protein